MASASSKSTKKTSKPKPKKTTVASVDEPRRIKLGSYKSMRLQKRIKHPIALPSVWYLVKQTYQLLKQHRKVIFFVTFIYGLLNLILVRGLAGDTDLETVKASLDQIFTGNLGSLTAGLGTFLLLLGSSGNATSQTAGSYQLFLTLIVSLAVIWLLRQLMAGIAVRARDAYYQGMYPLIPFVLVLMVICLQLIPAVLGSTLYGLVISNGIAVEAVEKVLWVILFGLLALLSLYMLSSSLFALYIVTLPDMTPLKALRSARELVRFRRWTVMRKIIALPVILFIGAAVITVPIIILLTSLAQWVFFILTMFALVAIHSYMYVLYRELLRD